MSEGPVTWDASGKLVPLTQEEQERLNVDAHQQWVESGNAAVEGPAVIPVSRDTGCWMILRDLGEMGVDAVSFSRRDVGSGAVIVTPGAAILGVLLVVALFVVGLVLLPLSLLARWLGQRGYQASLDRAAKREKALERYLG